MLKEPLRLPYLVTTGPLSTPNLTLLFREPRRAPRLRWSRAISASGTLGSFRHRLREGALLDGVMLRCADPETALHTLGAGRVEVTYTPDGWLGQHRRVVENAANAKKYLPVPLGPGVFALSPKQYQLSRSSSSSSWANSVFFPRATG